MTRGWPVMAIAAVLAAAPAVADVIASPMARHCYEMAASGATGRSAIRACDRALADRRLSPAARAATLTNRGIVRINSGDSAGALADYDAALALAPDSAAAHANRGLALLHQGRDRDAETALSVAIELGPPRPEVAYYARGLARESLGQLRSAYTDYGLARQLAPQWDAPARELARFRIVRRKTMSA